jgi:hypothetical protein
VQIHRTGSSVVPSRADFHLAHLQSSTPSMDAPSSGLGLKYLGEEGMNRTVKAVATS